MTFVLIRTAPHEGCRFAYEPKTREQYWSKKFEANTKWNAAALRDL